MSLLALLALAVSGVAYGPGPAETLDVYPSALPGSPVVVVLHGGGWVGGDKADSPPVSACQTFQAMNMTCFSVNYGLTSAYRWPVQMTEMSNLVAWVQGNAADYNGDASRLGLFGFSAGGHVALEAAYRIPGIRTVVSWSGPTDLVAWKHYAPVYCSTLSAFCMGLRHDASPVEYVNPSSPPTFIAHAVYDRTVPFSQSVELDAVLTANGVRHEFFQSQGYGHGSAVGAWPQTKAWMRAELG